MERLILSNAYAEPGARAFVPQSDERIIGLVRGLHCHCDKIVGPDAQAG